MIHEEKIKWLFQKLKLIDLYLRKFEEKDIQALYLLLKDEEVNTFLHGIL